MATVTRNQTYPVERNEAFAYLTDPSTWPDYYSGIIEIDDANAAKFEKVGDAVNFTYCWGGDSKDEPPSTRSAQVK